MLVLVITNGMTAQAHANVDPALGGHWVLDPERSDSFDRASRRALSNVERILRPRGNMPDPGTRQRQEAARAVLAPLDPPRQTVTIGLAEGQVELQLDDRAPRRLHADGRPAVIDSEQRTVSITEWEAGRLYVEQTSNRGTRVLTAWWVENGRLFASHEARNTLFGDPIRFTLQFVRAPTPVSRADARQGDPPTS